MDVILNWALRAAFVVVGLGAGVWIFRWLIASWRGAEERWPLRIAIGMLLLAVVYGFGHYRLLADQERIDEGRQRYSRFGDPRRTELRRAEVRGWMFDCTGDPAKALAVYRERNGVVERTYPLGAAGANLVGGGPDADERDYTIERLFADRLREPASLLERGELHPAGTDMGLTLCSDLTMEAWRLLRSTNRPGAIVVQDVQTGAVLAYTATGAAEDAPFGIKRYAPPGSVFKLALAALWWEHNLPDDVIIPCPASIVVNDRGQRIQNFEGRAGGQVRGPAGMLVPSCNTAAVQMAWQMREQIGEQAFLDAYQRYGFLTYPSNDEAPTERDHTFWMTGSRDFASRMTPPPNRVRISENTGRSEWAQLSIGQGPVDVTVIGVSRFIQAIGNGGRMLQPKVDWEALEQAEEDGEEGVQIMRPDVALKLQTAMIAVGDSGTARAAQSYYGGTGWDMGAKTGTAQIPGRPDDGWLAALVFDPEGHARYTVVVYLQGGGPGSRMPTAVAGQMVRALVAHRRVQDAERPRVASAEVRR